MGTFVHPLDEVNREIQVNRLKALISTYPEAEGYFLNVGEMYPDLNNEKHRTFFNQKRPEFFELRQARFPWVIDIAPDSDPVVDSNLGSSRGLCFNTCLSNGTLLLQGRRSG